MGEQGSGSGSSSSRRCHQAQEKGGGHQGQEGRDESNPETPQEGREGSRETPQGQKSGFLQEEGCRRNPENDHHRSLQAMRRLQDSGQQNRQGGGGSSSCGNQQSQARKGQFHRPHRGRRRT